MKGGCPYHSPMDREENILIVGDSALHVLMHGDWAHVIVQNSAIDDPLGTCAATLEGLTAFNTHNPLYGPPPITLLTSSKSMRRFTPEIHCRVASQPLPPESFFALREGLFVATPEYLLVHMAQFASEVQLAEIAMNLCGRYYVDARSGEMSSRSGFMSTPAKLAAYATAASHLRGSKKVLSALRWVMPNSGSPYETKMALLYSLPWGRGGFALPFSAMNYDIGPGRLQRMMAQGSYSIDLADPRRKIGLEYDGKNYHEDVSGDKRRRNELEALGWRVFPIDKETLHDPAAAIRTGEQLAKCMKVRLRRPASWQEKHGRLRAELGLPTRRR